MTEPHPARRRGRNVESVSVEAGPHGWLGRWAETICGVRAVAVPWVHNRCALVVSAAEQHRQPVGEVVDRGAHAAGRRLRVGVPGVLRLVESPTRTCPTALSARAW